MGIKRFGKSSSALLNQKTSFFEENSIHLKKQRDIAALCIAQPRRETCMNCTSELGESVDFTKDEIGYILCNTCGHLNGVHQDTTAFCEALYTQDDGKSYAQNYNSADVDSYNYRATSIYLPKAEFLQTSLIANNVNPHDLKYLDFGTGTGYFVAAMKKMGLRNVSGTEVSRTQVALGNAMIGEEVLQIHKMENTEQMLATTDANVISMIGVLEHIQEPHTMLTVIKNNPNIQFLYISVPTFSLSTYLEMLSPDVFNRQLSCAHTHLYTEDSLQHLATEFDFNIIGEWWFGTDMVDVFRHLLVNLEHQGASEKLVNQWKKDFIPLIDAMQMEIDKQKYASEVHILFQKK
jgi:cyclopropane fatty-acyl-phospholipid synthase-like methyltransferase